MIVTKFEGVSCFRNQLACLTYKVRLTKKLSPWPGAGRKMKPENAHDVRLRARRTVRSSPYIGNIWSYMVHMWSYMGHIWAIYYGPYLAIYGPYMAIYGPYMSIYGPYMVHIWAIYGPYMVIYGHIYDHICPYMAIYGHVSSTLKVIAHHQIWKV